MIAVTGSSGLLGSFIVRKLTDMNEPFVAFRRKDSDISLLKDLDNRIDWRYCDVCDPVSLEEALHGVTTVIHAAAVVSFNPRDEKKMFQVNVDGTRNLVNACLHNGVRRLVHVSSIAALGRQKDASVIDESNKWSDDASNTAYAESKYMAELEVFRGQEEGLSTVIVNPSVILAPANWHQSSAQIFRYIWKERPFYFNATLNVVDVRDVVDIIYQLMLTPNEAERFIINAGTISVKDLFNKIASSFNKKSPSIAVSKTLLKLVAVAEEMRTFFTGTTPLLTRETARLAGTNIFCNNQKVKDVLNYEFRSIDATLHWCCEYYLRQVNGEK